MCVRHVVLRALDLDWIGAWSGAKNSARIEVRGSVRVLSWPYGLRGWVSAGQTGCTVMWAGVYVESDGIKGRRKGEREKAER